MRITGVEPARLLTLEPKSSASANSAISAGSDLKSLYDNTQKYGYCQFYLAKSSSAKATAFMASLP